MSKRAFTLIELLIVVLIIAILAAIAIPNFLEFQTRAKVSRAKADMRTIATGLEAYCVDEGTYPAANWSDVVGYSLGLYFMTTPIAYLTTLPHDPFGERVELGSRKIEGYEFGSGKAGIHYSGSANYPNDIWELESSGPDNIEDTLYSFATMYFPWVGTGSSAAEIAEILALIYDPTNGTVSRGQIFRAGGSPPPELSIKMWFDQVMK